MCGDASEWLVALPENSVDLFFTSPPYADARPYCAVRPDDYVEWFEPFAEAMLKATADSGSMVVNIKNRVASSGPLRGQRHPYVFELVLRLQSLGGDGWRPMCGTNPTLCQAVSGRAPRTASSSVSTSLKGSVRTSIWTRCGSRIVPTPRKSSAVDATPAVGATLRPGSGGTIQGVRPRAGIPAMSCRCRRLQPAKGPAGAHTAVMPERVAEHFVKMLCPPAGLVVDPFAGSGTTVVAARAHGRRGAGIELHPVYAAVAVERVEAASARSDG